MNIQLPSYVQFALDRLSSAGYEAFAVGGCVRDSYLGLLPHDWDVTTSALPEQTKQVFSDCKTLDIGAKHGTIALVLSEEILEITTYRLDGDYKDHRHPNQVSFTSQLKEDLSRRDFTMNAMAYAPQVGLVDVFDGRGDLDRKLVRCVGNPDVRFTEDALRMLRALRFGATLGFALETETAASIRRNCHLIEAVSSERIQSELRKLIMGTHAGQVLDAFPEVLQCIFPNYMEPDQLKGALTQAEPNESVRFALLLRSTPAPLECLRERRFPSGLQKEVAGLCATQEVVLNPDRISVRKALSTYGPNTLRQMIQFRTAQGQSMDAVVSMLKQVEADGDCVHLQDLKLSGKDLEKLGYVGPQIKRELETLLKGVMEEAITNEQDLLLQQAKQDLSQGEYYGNLKN